MGTDKDRMNKIREILKTLTKREENVLSLYFGIGNNKRSNFSEIGQDYDITVNTVKKIKNRGVCKLIFRLKTIKELTPLISHIDNGLDARFVTHPPVVFHLILDYSDLRSNRSEFLIKI